MLPVKCPQCERGLEVEDSFAGTNVHCPGCTGIVAVPLVVGSSGTPEGEQPVSAVDQVPTTPPVGMLSTVDLPARHAPEPAPLLPVSILLTGEQDTAFPYLDPPLQADELGRLASYRVLSVLGAGGMGMVFLAEDPGLKRRVALKTMLPALAANPDAHRRFLREARAAAALQHDHVVAIHQVGEHNGVPFLAMPLLQGESLEERLKRDRDLPLPELLRIGAEIADGLAAAHEAGLVHRDIKPGNLFLESPHGRVKILDFGLARSADGGQEDGDPEPLTGVGAVLGTPGYMAPEQAAGMGVDARSDLFSLGCVLYRMATGQSPFRGSDSVRSLRDPARRQLPEAFCDLVMRLLAPGPNDRPSSAREVKHALESLPTAGGNRANQSKPANPRPATRWWPLAVGPLLLMVMGGGAILMRIAGPTSPATELDAPAPPTGWVDYRPRGFGFAVWLPGEPEVEDIPAGGRNVRQARIADPAAGLVYLVNTSDFPGIAMNDHEERLSLARDGAVQKTAGRVLSEKPAALGDYPGKEFDLETDNVPGAVFRNRMYLVKQRLYQLVVIGVPDAVKGADAERFLKSFRLVGNDH